MGRQCFSADKNNNKQTVEMLVYSPSLTHKTPNLWRVCLPEEDKWPRYSITFGTESSEAEISLVGVEL